MEIREVYKKALENKFAIGAFNFYNLESLQAILDAAEEERSAVICAVSDSALKYMGEKATVDMFRACASKISVPAFLHLDHGKDFEICKKAIDLGFDSVMIDASHLSFEENIKETAAVVKYAHSKEDVFVEGELGALAGIEDEVKVESNDAKFTNPGEAEEFVKRTNVDSLAIAIGTSHGAYKFKGESKLRIDILSEIENKIPSFPLVLHGASGVDAYLVENINKFGGNIAGAKGVSNENVRECAMRNICKVNVDTDLRMAFTSAIRQFLNENNNNFNPRDILKQAKNEMKKVVKNKMKEVLNSSNQF